MALGPSGRTGPGQHTHGRRRGGGLGSLTVRAHQGVGLPGPGHGSGDGVGKVEARQPLVALSGKLAVGDVEGQLVGPALGERIGLAAQAAYPLFDNGRVPDVVQVELAGVPEDVDGVAAEGDVFVVQRLVQVADKVDDKLGGLGAAPGGEGGFEGLARVVCEGVDDAARGLAVALKVDAAGARRVVVGVDEVKGLCEAAPFGVADRVGPAGDASEVVVAVGAEELLQVGLGRAGDEAAGEVGGGDVAEAWRPSARAGGGGGGGRVGGEGGEGWAYCPRRRRRAARGGRGRRRSARASCRASRGWAVMVDGCASWGRRRGRCRRHDRHASTDMGSGRTGL